jgi:membrane protease YdiL (CAAX protease family)
LLVARAVERLRAVAWVLGFYALAFATTSVALLAFPPPPLPHPIQVFATTPALFLGAAIATTAAGLLRRNAAAIGWPGLRAAARGVIDGTGVGAAMGVVALVACFAAGARWGLTGESVTSYVPALGLVLSGIAVAALAEELLFRGFPLATLAGAFGRAGAAGVLAVAFGLVHGGNPSVTPLGLANIMLASVVLSWAFFTRGALVTAWSLHAGWNGALAAADVPVSGIGFDLPGVDYAAGAHWLTGGSFGPEGGVAATAAMVGGLTWFAVRARRAGAAAA